MGRVQDKVVVVTGAANGLGEATALRLAQDGAKMVLEEAISFAACYRAASAADGLRFRLLDFHDGLDVQSPHASIHRPVWHSVVHQLAHAMSAPHSPWP